MCAKHMEDFLDAESLKLRVSWAVQEIHRRELVFDTLAFRGSSGTLIAAPLAVELQKSMILVRRLSDFKDRVHSSHVVEGDQAARTYLIVDDFIFSGRTVACIIDAIKQFAPRASCIGMLQVHPQIFASAAELARWGIKTAYTEYTECIDGLIS